MLDLGFVGLRLHVEHREDSAVLGVLFEASGRGKSRTNPVCEVVRVWDFGSLRSGRLNIKHGISKG